jgi:hypothetical protein
MLTDDELDKRMKALSPEELRRRARLTIELEDAETDHLHAAAMLADATEAWDQARRSLDDARAAELAARERFSAIGRALRGETPPAPVPVAAPGRNGSIDEGTPPPDPGTAWSGSVILPDGTWSAPQPIEDVAPPSRRKAKRDVATLAVAPDGSLVDISSILCPECKERESIDAPAGVATDWKAVPIAAALRDIAAKPREVALEELDWYDVTTLGDLATELSNASFTMAGCLSDLTRAEADAICAALAAAMLGECAAWVKIEDDEWDELDLVAIHEKVDAAPPATVETMPDGGSSRAGALRERQGKHASNGNGKPLRKPDSRGLQKPPEGGWTGQTMYAAAGKIMHKPDPGIDRLKGLAVCPGCKTMQRTGPECGFCKGHAMVLYDDFARSLSTPAPMPAPQVQSMSPAEPIRAAVAPSGTVGQITARAAKATFREPIPTEEVIDAVLRRSLQGTEANALDWDGLAKSGATDWEVREAIARSWPRTLEHWIAEDGLPAFTTRGTDHSAAIWVGKYRARGTPTVAGQPLVDRVRRVMGVPVRKERPTFIDLPEVDDDYVGWNQATLAAAASELGASPGDLVVCNRCEAARRKGLGACPSCRCPEYRLAPKVIADSPVAAGK